jgi:hypothetical protein
MIVVGGCAQPEAVIVPVRLHGSFNLGHADQCNMSFVYMHLLLRVLERPLLHAHWHTRK